MKAHDITEIADDRQLYLMFYSETQELFSLTESGQHDAWTGKFIIGCYMLDRHKGFSHSEALQNAQAALISRPYLQTL